jgi:peptidoglycan hydrolase-like protein with peptidoglycan-binding domain
VRRALRTTLAAGSIGLVVAAVTGAALGLGDGTAGGAGDPGAEGDPTATEAVTRTTLTQAALVAGTISHGDPVTVTGPGSGVVTWLPAPGAVVRRGQPMYKVDNKPVTLFLGNLPLYRPLRVGDTGDDVYEVERNLAALGYAGVTVDHRYTAATATAVRRFQRDRGVPQTGALDPAGIVVAPAEPRIADLVAHLGDRAEGPALTYTGTSRVVRIDLEVALQGLVRPGTPATVTLPDGNTVEGRVTAVGAVATGGESPDDPVTIDVTVTVPDQRALGRLDRAPVSVRLAAATRANVLAVPVVALVALAEGGYGVQVADGTGTRYVAVRLGMFADGRVEVSGDGIAEGTRVVVPS